MNKKTLISLSLFFVLLISVGWISLAPAEGMFPLSEIHKLDLVKAGLKINPEEIYNPNGISLIDAFVNIRGCTGSFVSENGLVLTNHHCGFGYVSRASTPENNYLKDGFLAKTYREEIPATGNYCKITESYEDVSDIILNSVKDITDPVKRVEKINEKMRDLADAANDPENNIEAEVSEMFIGKTYILFKYSVIKDVRLVYVPPKAIGNFGGETDNWTWPRHTGDFTFMRAYVAPDGSAAEYSEDNVPYKPKKWLRINPNGVNEGDFVFILGYPGQTFRNRPAKYYEYREKYVLPYISDLNGWLINQSNEISKGDEALELKFANIIKSWANVMKKYRGQLKGFRSLSLVDTKRKEEEELISFINSSGELKENYGQLFADLNKAYDELHEIAKTSLWFEQLFTQSALIAASNYILKYSVEYQKEDQYRKAGFKDKNLSRTKSYLNYYMRNTNLELQKRFLIKMINDARNFEEGSKIEAVEELFGQNVEEFVATLIDEKIQDKIVLDELSMKTPEEIDEMNNNLLNFVKELNVQRSILSEKNSDINGKLNFLLAQLIDVKRLRNKQSFVPDANSTLRLTYGYIKGYEPVDAVYKSPMTRIEGILEKNMTGNEDYELPQDYIELIKKKDYGQFYEDEVGSVPVAILYNTDTTGGNSGSPVLNAYGELIGLNFDRAFEATINDYDWDDSFSRSIGVDVRYILWVAQKYSGADHLLEEIGVNN